MSLDFHVMSKIIPSFSAKSNCTCCEKKGTKKQYINLFITNVFF